MLALFNHAFYKTLDAFLIKFFLCYCFKLSKFSLLHPQWANDKFASQTTLTEPVCKSQNSQNSLFYDQFDKYFLKNVFDICLALTGSTVHK